MDGLQRSASDAKAAILAASSGFGQKARAVATEFSALAKIAPGQILPQWLMEFVGIAQKQSAGVIDPVIRRLAKLSADPRDEQIRAAASQAAEFADKHHASEAKLAEVKEQLQDALRINAELNEELAKAVAENTDLADRLAIAGDQVKAVLKLEKKSRERAEKAEKDQADDRGERFAPRVDTETIDLETDDPPSAPAAAATKPKKSSSSSSKSSSSKDTRSDGSPQKNADSAAVKKRKRHLGEVSDLAITNSPHWNSENLAPRKKSKSNSAESAEPSEPTRTTNDGADTDSD